MDEVGQASQHGRCGSGAGAACVLVEGHVPHIMHAVLHRPVPAGVRGQLRGRDLVGVQVGNGEDHLAAALDDAVWAAVALDAHRLARPGKGQPVHPGGS